MLFRSLYYYVVTRSGYYSLQTVDSNGCVTLSPEAYITVNGITDLAEGERVSVYPNPTTGVWQLCVSSELVGSVLAIYDEQGRLVFQSQIRDLQSEITVDIAAGIYYLHISSPNANLTRKLVKL